MPLFGLERLRQLELHGVYRIPPNFAHPVRVEDPALFTQPDGLCFDPIERYLYVNDTEQANIRRFAVMPDGGLDASDLFAEGLASDNEPGRPDGMKTDEKGNVWCSGPGGIWVFSPLG